MDNIKILKKSWIYFIGNIASKLMSFFLLPIYAYYVPSHDLGEFDYVQTIVNIAVPVMFCAIWESVLRFILLSDSRQEKRKIITGVSFLMLFCTTIVGLIVIVSYVIHIRNSRLYLVAINTVVFAFAETWQYYARAFQNNQLYVLSGILSSLINFICVIIFVCIFRTGVTGLFIALLTGQILIFILIEIKLRILKYVSVQYFDVTLAKKLIKYAAPLVVNLISTWLIAGFGRILIVNRLGTVSNGLFSFASKFSLIITTIGSVIIKAVIEESILEHDSLATNNAFGKTIDHIFSVFQDLSIIALPAVSIFFCIIEETDYYAALPYVPWLIVYALLTTLSSNIGAVFQAYNKTIFQMLATITGAIFMVILSVLLIDSYGLNAIVFAQVTGALVMMYLRYFFAEKLCKMSIQWKTIICKFAVYFCIAAISMQMDMRINAALFFILSALLIKKYYTVIRKWNGFKQKADRKI